MGAARAAVFLTAAGAAGTFLEAALGFGAWGFLVAGAWVMVLTGEEETALALGFEGVALAVTFLAGEEVLSGVLVFALDLTKGAAADLETDFGAGLAEALPTGLVAGWALAAPFTGLALAAGFFCAFTAALGCGFTSCLLAAAAPAGRCSEPSSLRLLSLGDRAPSAWFIP